MIPLTDTQMTKTFCEYSAEGLFCSGNVGDLLFPVIYDFYRKIQKTS